MVHGAAPVLATVPHLWLAPHVTRKAGGTGRLHHRHTLAAGRHRVWPGLIRTPIMEAFSKEVTEAVLSKVPLGFAAEPVDIAYGVLFLASDEARFVTGADIVIDGGFTAQ